MKLSQINIILFQLPIDYDTSFTRLTEFFMSTKSVDWSSRTMSILFLFWKSENLILSWTLIVHFQIHVVFHNIMPILIVFIKGLFYRTDFNFESLITTLNITYSISSVVIIVPVVSVVSMDEFMTYISSLLSGRFICVTPVCLLPFRSREKCFSWSFNPCTRFSPKALSLSFLRLSCSFESAVGFTSHVLCILPCFIQDTSDGWSYCY